MPPSRVTFRAAGSLAIRWTVMAFFTLAPALVAADHGAPVLPPKTGVDWTTWLLIAGAVAAVGLAAWAFLAPDRAESRDGSASSEGAQPRPPTR
jgi:LPXTG-motif cell wall-anchored protein